MRLISFIPLASLVLAACSAPTPPVAPLAVRAAGPQPPPSLAASAPQETTQPAPPAPRAPAVLISPLRAPAISRQEISGIRFEGISFDSRTHRLIVADQPGGPASRWGDAAAAGRAKGGIAAVNAGFFTPEGAPLGKVIASGTTAGAWNRGSSLGAGIWFQDGSGNPAIVRREKSASTGGARELLQAGPMLVDHATAVGGLDGVKSAVRTLILWDGGFRWWIGLSSPCTLGELGAAVAARSPAGWKVRQGLNLDGGRSSEIWAAGTVDGGPLQRRPVWNRPVRNFLVLVEN